MRGHFADGTESGVGDGRDEAVCNEGTEGPCALQSVSGTKEETCANGASDLGEVESALGHENLRKARTHGDHLYMALLETTLYTVAFGSIEVEMFGIGVNDIVVGLGALFRLLDRGLVLLIVC